VAKLANIIQTKYIAGSISIAEIATTWEVRLGDTQDEV